MDSPWLAGKVTFPCTKDKKACVKGWQNLTEKTEGVFDPEFYMIGLQCGKRNNLTVIDLDCKDDKVSGVKWFERMRKSFDAIDPTAFRLKPRPLITNKVNTPSGGVHYYFQYCGMLKTCAKCIWVHVVEKEGGPELKKFRVDIDIRSEGGYVICPPSMVCEGRGYEFEGQPKVGVQEVPCWFVEATLGGITYEKDVKLCYMRTPKPEQVTETAAQSALTFVEHPMPRNYTEKIEQVKEVLGGLGKDRVDSYDDWIRVLWALKSMSAKETEKEYLNMAIEWSRKSEKFASEENVTNVFMRANGHITGKTLWWMLKQDNPDKFAKLRHKNLVASRDTHKNPYVFLSHFEIWEKQDLTGKTDLDTIDDFIASVFAVVVTGQKRTYYAVEKRHESYVTWMLAGSEPLSHPPWVIEVPSMDEKSQSDSKNKKKKRDWCFITDRIHMAVIRRQIPHFGKVDFIPSPEGPKNNVSGPVFNLFKGFPFKARKLPPDAVQAAKLKIEPIRQHILQVLCCGDTTEAGYVEWWIGHILQRPAQKSNSLLAVLGTEGLGKDMIFNNFMCNLIGEWNHLMVKNLDELLGNFNSLLEAKLVVYISELQKEYQSTKGMAQLRALITNGRITIENKGVNSYVVNDYARYVAAGNNRHSFNLSMNDRRFFVMKNFGVPCPKEYFKNLFDNCINSSDAIEAAFDYYFNLDLDSMGFSVDCVPSTKFKRTIQLNSLPNPQRFLLESLTIGSYHVDSLYQKYRNWAFMAGENQVSTRKNFVGHLGDLGIEVDRIRIRQERKDGFVFTEEHKKAFQERVANVIESNDSEEEKSSES